MTKLTNEMTDKLRNAILVKCGGHETHKAVCIFDEAVKNGFSNNSQRANILSHFTMTPDIMPKFSEVVALRKLGLSDEEITAEKDMIMLTKLSEKL